MIRRACRAAALTATFQLKRQFGVINPYAPYGLEPVFEPGGSDDVSPTEFVTVQCPRCREGFETAADLSAGSSA
jgi:hypothetical protein